ncbi:hypothetical protein R1sor_020785 [Riccia sorocarpa]|uniref:PGG domain-containing protein n=1 Tax=Riccia sorocarpa TaxID=122646 RepID=A0ABD3GJE1_9MARC
MDGRLASEDGLLDPLQKKYEIRVEAEKKTQQTLQRMQKDFVGSINAYALVLVLLATVTYAGFLQPPGGLDNDNHLLQRQAITVFIVFNSLSFFVSVADLLLCVISSLSPLATISTNADKDESALPETGERVGHLNLQLEQVTTQNLSQFVASTLFKLICVNAMFAVSLICCVVAFGAAGFAVVDLHDNRQNFLAVLVTAVLGGLLFLLFLAWLLRDTAQFITRALSEQSLSTSLQTRAGTLQNTNLEQPTVDVFLLHPRMKFFIQLNPLAFNLEKKEGSLKLKQKNTWKLFLSRIDPFGLGSSSRSLCECLNDQFQRSWSGDEEQSRDSSI